MIRVLIADDHAVVREGLKRILSQAVDIEVVAEAADGQETVEQAKREPLDVVVLDVSMPKKDGLRVLKELKSAHPDLAVLILSMHPEEEFAVRFLREGADGYMTKESAPDELLRAIRRIYDGGKYVSDRLAEELATRLSGKGDVPLHERLSDREYQVMCRIGSGRTVTEIGQELFLSVKTISTYRARILEKMDMKNNAEIMQYAIRTGLVD